MTDVFPFAQALARNVIENPYSHQWSVQGFGMLRTYLDPDKRWRLSIWHSALAVPNVSIIHDHPWDFLSLVLAGEFYNTRYTEDVLNSAATHMVQRIRTGEGGGPDGPATSVALVAGPKEVYGPGALYCQWAEEVHASGYVDGTVTLNDRTRRPDPDHALVFWPFGQEWVDAEPRPATTKEIIIATTAARKRFSE